MLIGEQVLEDVEGLRRALQLSLRQQAQALAKRDGRTRIGRVVDLEFDVRAELVPALGAFEKLVEASHRLGIDRVDLEDATVRDHASLGVLELIDLDPPDFVQDGNPLAVVVGKALPLAIQIEERVPLEAAGVHRRQRLAGLLVARVERERALEEVPRTVEVLQSLVVKLRGGQRENGGVGVVHFDRPKRLVEDRRQAIPATERTREAGQGLPALRIVRIFGEEPAVCLERPVEVLEMRLLHVAEMAQQLEPLRGVVFAIEARFENLGDLGPFHAAQVQGLEQLGGRAPVLGLFDERLQRPHGWLVLRVLAQCLAKLIKPAPRLVETPQAKLPELVANRGGISDALIDLPFVERCQLVPLPGSTIEALEAFIGQRVVALAERPIERLDRGLRIVELGLVKVRLTHQERRTFFAVLGQLSFSP